MNGNSMNISATIPRWMAKELGFQKGSGNSGRIQELLMKGLMREKEETIINSRRTSEPQHNSPQVGWSPFVLEKMTEAVA